MKQRPAKRPIAIDWPEEIYIAPEMAWSILIDGTVWSLAELSIEIDQPTLDGPLRLAIASDTDRAELALELLQRRQRAQLQIHRAGRPNGRDLASE